MKETIVVVIGLLWLLSVMPDCSGGNSRTSISNSESSKKRQAEKIVKNQLNYPSSYSLQGWAVDGNMVTLEYKAKNAFGMEKTQRQTIYVD